MANERRKSFFESSLFLTILALIVGFASRALALNFIVPDQQLAFLIGAVLALATLQIGNLYRHREITDDLTSLKEILTEHTQKLERHRLLKESIAFLEPAITDDRFLNTMRSLATSYEQVRHLKQQYGSCKDFFEWKENLIFESALPKLQQLAQRQIVIDKESKELTTNKDFLVKLPQDQVRAVSYQDDGFWDEAEGKDFLSAHTTMIGKGITISRIFILTEEEITTQRSVIENQVRMRILVRIIEARRLKDSEREDFVIYDDKYVRFARLYEDTGTNTLKHATLIIDTDKVKDFIERYESLYARSTDATDFYTLIDMSPAGLLVEDSANSQS